MENQFLNKGKHCGEAVRILEVPGQRQGILLKYSGEAVRILEDPGQRLSIQLKYYGEAVRILEDPGQRQGILLEYCGEAVGIQEKNTEWQHNKSAMERYKKKFLSHYCRYKPKEKQRATDR